MKRFTDFFWFLVGTLSMALFFGMALQALQVLHGR